MKYILNNLGNCGFWLWRMGVGPTLSCELKDRYGHTERDLPAKVRGVLLGGHLWQFSESRSKSNEQSQGMLTKNLLRNWIPRFWPEVEWCYCDQVKYSVYSKKSSLVLPMYFPPFLLGYKFANDLVVFFLIKKGKKWKVLSKTCA